MTVQQRRFMPVSHMMTNPVLPASNTSATGDHISGILSSGKKIIIKRGLNPIYSIKINTHVVDKHISLPVVDYSRNNKLDSQHSRNISLKENSEYCTASVPLNKKSLPLVPDFIGGNNNAQTSYEQPLYLTNNPCHSVLSISTMSDGSVLSGSGDLPMITEEGGDKLIYSSPSLHTSNFDESIPGLTDYVRNNTNNCDAEQYDCPPLLSDEYSAESYQQSDYSYDNDSMDGYRRPVYSYDNDSMDGYRRTERPDTRPRVRFAEQLTTIIDES